MFQIYSHSATLQIFRMCLVTGLLYIDKKPSFLIICDAIVTGEVAPPSAAPNWIRTLIMSIGWMQQVANMPLMEPVTKGLHAFQTGLSDMALDGGAQPPGSSPLLLAE